MIGELNLLYKTGNNTQWLREKERRNEGESRRGKPNASASNRRDCTAEKRRTIGRNKITVQIFSEIATHVFSNQIIIIILFAPSLSGRSMRHSLYIYRFKKLNDKKAAAATTTTTMPPWDKKERTKDSNSIILAAVTGTHAHTSNERMKKYFIRCVKSFLWIYMVNLKKCWKMHERSDRIERQRSRERNGSDTKLPRLEVFLIGEYMPQQKITL